jgi:hypothetical protein
MKLSQILPAVSILSLLFGTSCKKDNQCPQLPPITKTGANTFGCLVNGEPVVFTDIKKMSGGFIEQSDTSFGSLPYDSCDIWIYMESSNHRVNLFLNNPMEKTSWNLNQTTFGFPEVVLPKDYIFIDNKKTSQNTRGVFKSENFQVTKPIFSGTFEFECAYPKTCQTLKVTNGRLDVNLNDLM